MKKALPTARRPQDAMLRFDRLLQSMAPPVEAKRQTQPKPRKPRGPKPRKPMTR
jgi:hypothetical protein